MSLVLFLKVNNLVEMELSTTSLTCRSACVLTFELVLEILVKLIPGMTRADE